jgi:predicted methyltransferase
MLHKTLMASAVLAVILAASGPPLLHAQSPQAAPADALSDPTLKGPEVIAFIGVKSGDKVADIFAGRFVRAFSRKVGPSGKVYAMAPEDYVKALAAAPGNGNIVISSASLAAMDLTPASLDEAFIRQNYHDLYDFKGGDVPAFNRQVFAALKPGGVFVILDHAAPAGSGLADTNTTHRIDGERVKADMRAAGFVLDGESRIFANPADDRTKAVFDPAIRGKTDQFLLRFRKPK